MRTLTIYLLFILIHPLPLTAQPAKLDSTSAVDYGNCAEDWPDDWRKHEFCTEYQLYPRSDTTVINTRSLIQNWNTFAFTLDGNFKYGVPPLTELAFNLVIINPLGDTVYNRLVNYPIITESWSFDVGFLNYVYTDESINIVYPVSGVYTAQSIIMANQFTGHTVTLTFSIDSPVAVATVIQPNSAILQQNYPNPFNPVTNIEYSLTKTSSVKLVVYNLLGQEIAVLIDQEMPLGHHSIAFDASGLPGGTYFYQLQVGHYTETKKMSLLK